MSVPQLISKLHDDWSQPAPTWQFRLLPACVLPAVPVAAGCRVIRRTASISIRSLGNGTSKRDSRDRERGSHLDASLIPAAARACCDDASRIGEQNMPLVHRLSGIGLRVREDKRRLRESQAAYPFRSRRPPASRPVPRFANCAPRGRRPSICRCDACLDRYESTFGSVLEHRTRFRSRQACALDGDFMRPAGWSSPTGACSVRWRPSSSSAGYGSRSPMRRCVRMGTRPAMATRSRARCA